MFLDFILNGRGVGELAETLQGCRFDAGMLRPYIDSRGQKCVTINTGRVKADGTPERQKRLVAEMVNNGYSSPVFNATSLRKDEWVQLDRRVITAARQRLRAWSDLAAASSYGGFNGMSKTILEYETMSDDAEAVVDMDALTDGRQTGTRFQLEGLPLPITHSDFYFSLRQLTQSRASGMPLDVAKAEQAGRKVAEMIEKTLIGVETGITYGNSSEYGRTSSVYGYTNFPDRILKTDLTTPTGTNPEAIMQDVLEMREQLFQAGFYGPFMLYHSTSYDQYLDNDYFRTGGTSASTTLRQRIQDIDGIGGIRRLDFLTSGFQMILVQMTANVAQAINGMDITTVQWESVGGLRLNFKVMAIQVPLLRADYNGNAGILHATTA